MKVSRKINIDVVKTLRNAVADSKDFHFFVDELTQDNYMPTYAGVADEKYGFDAMDDAFFEFVERKIHENGIYIRLIHATGEMKDGCVTFTLECGSEVRTFQKRSDFDLLVFEFADFGIKVLNNEVTLGATVEGGCAHTPYFAEFGSDKGNEKFLSLSNPLNQFVIDLLWNMIIFDEV